MINKEYPDSELTRKIIGCAMEGKIMVEIKAITELENVHLAQAINYLEAYRLSIGLLINFGNTNLQFKRVMNRKNQSPHGIS